MAKKFLLALDAGHGLNTPGKRCLKSIDPCQTREWWLNNRMSNYIAERANLYEGFSAILMRVTPAESAPGVVHFTYHGNRNIGSSSITRTGFGMRSTSATVIANVNNTALINGKGYAQHMRVDSSGDLYQYLIADYILKAGTYQIILTCTT